MPQGFDDAITFLYTRDLEAAHRFYSGLLGLEMILDQGSCRIYRAAAGAYLGFCQRETAPEQPPDFVIVTFVTPDVDGWYAALKREGVVFEGPPALNETYGIYHCFLRDPDGYRLEIQRFLDAGWNRPG